MKKVNKNGQDNSIIINVLLGALIGILISITCAALLATLVSTDRLSEDIMGYGGMIIIILSSYVGALVARSRSKEKYLLMTIMSGSTYFLILLSITALFFKGQYTGVTVTALCVAAASLCAAMTGFQRRKRKIHRRE